MLPGKINKGKRYQNKSFKWFDLNILKAKYTFERAEISKHETFDMRLYKKFVQKLMSNYMQIDHTYKKLFV